MTRLSNRAVPLVLVAFLIALGATSCKRDPVAKTRTPEGAVQAGADALKAGDLRAFVLSQVPPEGLQQLRADWVKKSKGPIDLAESKRFSEQMAKFSAADAPDKIMSELEPKLAEFEREGAAQMPMLIGAMTGVAQASIKNNKDFDEAAKAQAMKMVNALTTWLGSAEFTDRAKVRASVTALSKAARESKVREFAAWRALPFEDALDEYSRGFRAIKTVLATYGLPLDPVFASVKTKVLSQSGNTAKVRMSYRMLETDFTHDMDMVKIEDRWYGSKTADQVGKMLVDKDKDESAGSGFPVPLPN